jgi:hypothetical protein
MNDREFVDIIRRCIIEENLAYYTNIMESDEHIGKGLDDFTLLYRSLPLEMREVFIRTVKRVEVDTISNILGILDGSSAIADYRGEFSLHYDEGQNITGDLQDFFLSDD